MHHFLLDYLTCLEGQECFGSTEITYKQKLNISVYYNIKKLVKVGGPTNR